MIEKWFSKLENKKRRIGISVKSAWFRGQSNTWNLDVSLNRFYMNDDGEYESYISDNLPITPIEESLFCEFSQRNREYSFPSSSSWEILGVMQHYGVPTRLLDWTENFFIAAYFALEKAYDPATKKIKDGYSPCIYLLNPFKLSEKSERSDYSKLPEYFFRDKNKVWNMAISKELDYLENVVVEKQWHFKSPVPIFSPWTNPRIEAQEGVFTFQGLDMTPLNKQGISSSCLEKIVIDSDEVAKYLWDTICQHHISKYTLFKDLDSLADFLKVKYKVEKRGKPSLQDIHRRLLLTKQI